ncbi:hypothetical protein GBF38_014759 [Nibea albiflora]|uniref:Uncharacterized protein n=1 Tax=Nibea albiflora TaxID=240163 RepID=A0ACB7EKD4_NIBAL|nr:hypothetical protein GBF38_014759 [Nibea albiflora]
MSSLEGKSPRRITTTFLGPVTEPDKKPNKKPELVSEPYPDTSEFDLLECDCGYPHPHQHPYRPAVEDEADGLLESVTLKKIKAIVFHLLRCVLIKYQRENCNGCQTNHPSQRQHECLTDIEDGYYRNNFQQLMKKLNTPNFIPAVHYFLAQNQIKVGSERKLETVVEGILQNLKLVDHVYDAIDDATVTPPELDKEHFEFARKIWKGRNETWEKTI